MQYAKIVEGIVASVGDLPRNLKTGTNTIINFDKLAASELKAHGYLPVTDVTVPYNKKYMSLGPPEYTTGVDSVVLIHQIVTMDLLMYKQQEIRKAYQAAKQIMDAQTAGYSQAEVATWPAIQVAVVAYNADNLAIGAALQQAADTSAYTVAELAAMLTPRITVQATAISDRATAVAAILAAVDHASV